MPDHSYFANLIWQIADLLFSHCVHLSETVSPSAMILEMNLSNLGK